MKPKIHPSDENSSVNESTPTWFGGTAYRQRIINLISSSYFDAFILVAIILNSILIACVDYRVVDDNYQPSIVTSTRNNVIEKCEVIFTVVFATECLLKIIAYGFIKGKHSYIRDGWNVLDFIIVVISIIGLIPGLPNSNLSVLRSFRVLRPLRSISKLKSLRKIATAFIESIGDLVNVGFVLLFVLVFFTLFGVTFWRGLFHMRCRLTPFPVKMPLGCEKVTDKCWEDFLLDVVTNPDAYRCLPYPNDDVDAWTQSSSPWFTYGPQDCVWPIDATDLRICSSSSGLDSHSCSRPVTFMGDVDVIRTCGSNYDAFGNPRFIDSHIPYGFPRMQSGTFNEASNWGFTSYDNFMRAFVTTFQVVTMEGWTDIMARVCDAWSTIPAIIVFVSLILLGGIIALNIVLAVISGSLDKIENKMAKEEEEEGGEVSSVVIKEQKDSFFRRKSDEILLASKNIFPRNSATCRKLKVVVTSRLYQRSILATILLNTIVLSCDHYGISRVFQMVLDAGNFVTTIIFFVDMLLCNIVYGIDTYWSTSSTCFDGIIAVSSVFELILARMAGGGSSGKSVMSVFRSLRLIRLLKMVKSWKSLHSLLNTMARAASDVKSFGILLFLFVFIYALVGMQLFANRLHFDKLNGALLDISDLNYASGDVPRSNFDNFFWSMITVFQVLSGENWNTVMYDCWKATPASPVYFLSLVILGVFCAMNLFLAILLAPFDGSELVLSNRIHPQGEPINNYEKEQSLIRLKAIADGALKWMRAKFPCLHSSPNYEFIRSKCEGFVADKRFDVALTCVIIMSSITLALDNPLLDPNSAMAAVLLVLNYAFTSIFIVEFLVKLITQGPIKYMQDRWNVLDFTTVVASILELANIRGGKTLRVLRVLRVLRPLKMIKKFPEIKVVVDALLMSLPSVVDVGVICVLFFLVFSIFGVTFLKGSFYKCEGNVLTPEEINLITYPSLVGELSSTELSWLENCDAASSWKASKLPTSRELCNCLDGAEWVQTIPQNFNNVLNGFGLLFEISTTESWTDVMYASIDQRGIDMQPVRDNNRLWAIYFVVFLVFGAFFILELFVGVIIENFSRLREIKGHGLMMTDAQRQWAQTQNFIMKIRPEVLLRRPEARIKAMCYDIIMPGTNPWFDRFIAATIVTNSISIAMVSFGDSSSEQTVMILGLLNSVFAGIFVVEAILKLLALGKRYFRSKWNIFDFAIVVGLIIGFILQLTISNQRLAASISSLMGLIRMFRLIRLVRLVSQLRAPFNTMVSVAPGMFNIGSLLLLLFFVYAVCGVQLYGTVAFQGELNEQNNFRSVGQAMLLLLRFSTGENWNGFMYGLMKERNDCDSDPTYNESSPWCLNESDYPNCSEINGCSASGYIVFAYFYSFTMIVSFVILNMFVAIVLQAFEASNEGEILEPKDLEHFVSVWSKFDPDATWFINAADVQSFLSKLKPPLGMAGQPDNDKGELYVNDPCLLKISVNDKKQVNIVNVAHLLAKRIAKEKQGNDFGELSDDHPVSCRLTKKSSLDEATSTLGDVYMDSSLVILRSVIRFKNRRRQDLVLPQQSTSLSEF